MHEPRVRLGGAVELLDQVLVIRRAIQEDRLLVPAREARSEAPPGQPRRLVADHGSRLRDPGPLERLGG